MWDGPIEGVYRLPDGSYSSARELYSQGRGNSRINREPAGMRFNRNTHHGAPLKLDKSEWAYCAVCSLIFNDGPSDADHEAHCVGYEPTIESKDSPPPARYRKPKRAAR